VDRTRAQVLAHRAAVQDLHGGAAFDGLDVLALGFVDSPPKTGNAGIAVRVGPAVGELTRVLSLRGAPHLHRAADLPTLRRELRPRNRRQLAAWVGGWDVPDLAHLDLLVELLHREFPGDLATKGELSGAVSPLLPDDLTPWCPACKVNHVMDGVFRLGTLLAGIELEPFGAKLVFRKPTGPLPAVEPEGRLTLVRAYARLVGPFAKADAEKWLGAGPRPTWPELRPVTVDGKRLLELADVEDAPPPPRGGCCSGATRTCSDRGGSSPRTPPSPSTCGGRSAVLVRWSCTVRSWARGGTRSAGAR
jgi:hypothetical protein